MHSHAHAYLIGNLQHPVGFEFLSRSSCSQQEYLEPLDESRLHKVALDSFENTTAFED